MDRPIAFRRAGGAADYERLASLADAIWREHYIPIIGLAQVDYMLHRFQSAQAIERQVAEGLDYYLMESGGIPVGYLAFDKRGDELFLSKIYLLKEYRGRGHGRQAMAFVIEKARELECSRVALTVNKNNSKSIDAYLKMGFLKERPLVMDIGGGFVMDDFRMVRELP